MKSERYIYTEWGRIPARIVSLVILTSLLTTLLYYCKTKKEILNEAKRISYHSQNNQNLSNDKLKGLLR